MFRIFLQKLFNFEVDLCDFCSSFPEKLVNLFLLPNSGLILIVCYLQKWKEFLNLFCKISSFFLRVISIIFFSDVANFILLFGNNNNNLLHLYSAFLGTQSALHRRGGGGGGLTGREETEWWSQSVYHIHTCNCKNVSRPLIYFFVSLLKCFRALSTLKI